VVLDTSSIISVSCGGNMLVLIRDVNFPESDIRKKVPEGLVTGLESQGINGNMYAEPAQCNQL